MSLKPIETLEDIYDYLYAALQLEHATIPPYLTALYTIRSGTNSDAAQIIRAVVVEEMLHLTLSANILNAINGSPDLTQADFVPQYPAYLPDGETDFQVDLLHFSPEAIETFLHIERPARPTHKAQVLVRHDPSRRNILPVVKTDDNTELRFYSIGEFYQAIEEGLEKICRQHGDKEVFCGDRSRQVTPEYYYSGGGELIPVYDLESAKAAIRLISEQGEGYNGGIFDNEEEISHYYRFQQLKLGRYYLAGDSPGTPTGGPVNTDWNAVFPIVKNARLQDYESNPELYDAALSFNEYYKQFLSKLTIAFRGRPDLLLEAVPDMFRIKEKMTRLFHYPVRLPQGGSAYAAPTFEMPQ